MTKDQIPTAHKSLFLLQILAAAASGRNWTPVNLNSIGVALDSTCLFCVFLTFTSARRGRVRQPVATGREQVANGAQSVEKASPADAGRRDDVETTPRGLGRRRRRRGGGSWQVAPTSTESTPSKGRSPTQGLEASSKGPPTTTTLTPSTR